MLNNSYSKLSFTNFEKNPINKYPIVKQLIHLDDYYQEFEDELITENEETNKINETEHFNSNINNKINTTSNEFDQINTKKHKEIYESSYEPKTNNIIKLDSQFNKDLILSSTISSFIKTTNIPKTTTNRIIPTINNQIYHNYKTIKDKNIDDDYDDDDDDDLFFLKTNYKRSITNHKNKIII